MAGPLLEDLIEAVHRYRKENRGKYAQDLTGPGRRRTDRTEQGNPICRSERGIIRLRDSRFLVNVRTSEEISSDHAQNDPIRRVIR